MDNSKELALQWLKGLLQQEKAEQPNTVGSEPAVSAAPTQKQNAVTLTPEQTKQGALAWLSGLKAEDAYAKENPYYRYQKLTKAQDFAEKSKYVSTANGKERTVFDLLFDNYDPEKSGWDDPLYEHINGNQEASAWISNAAAAGYGDGLGAIYGRKTEGKNEAQQMTEEEVSIFNYLYATQGKESAHEFYEYLESDLYARDREASEAYWAQYAKDDPFGSSVFSAITSPLKGLSYLGQATDMLTTGTIDKNAPYNSFVYENSAIRSQVAKSIEESGKWGPVGSFAYQTAMSMADFLTTTAVSGGNGALSMLIMGSGAAADTTLAAKDRGLSDFQAFTLGTIAGAAEAVTERFSLEALLKPNMSKTAVEYILKNVLTEAAEEGASTLINTMADVIISQDQSEWARSIQAYRDSGKSEAEAFGLALADQAASLGLDMLGGAISGGFMGTGGAVVNYGGSHNQNVQQVQGTQGAAQGGENAQQAQKEHISMEDYANHESPVWRNVEYTDNETKAAITQEAHDRMVSAGAVVKVSEEVLGNVEQSFPDLRNMKKKDRTPILKDAIGKLKNNLRQFLNKFSGQNFEFEVNGKILDATLYSTGIDEVMEKVTQEKANMLYSTEDIFRNAQYLYSTTDYGGDPNVYRWNYFYTPVQIGEDTVGVRIAVRDMVKGTSGDSPESQIYNWGIKKDASLDGGSHDPKAASSDVSSDASNNNIAQGVPSVNPNESVGAADGDDGANTVGAARSQFHHEVRKSKLYENTYANATDETVQQVGKAALEDDPSIAEYDYISEGESLHNAKLRTRTARERGTEYTYLMKKDGWTGEDNDTAMELLKALMKNGDKERFDSLAKKQKSQQAQGGQLIQSNAKYSRSATQAAIDAMEALDGMKPDQVDKRYYAKKATGGKTTIGKDVYYQTDTGKLAQGVDNMEQKEAAVGKRLMSKDDFAQWKTSVSGTILDVANAIENTEEGNVTAMREIIRSMARFRHTTAWFGTQSRLTGIAEKALQTVDFDTAKDIALAQLRQIPNDFKKRSVGQVVKTIRIHNMLGSLTTVNRNLAGNTSIGILDAISDSTVGRALDALVAKKTGKRTVGNDIRYSKEYFEGAKKAAQMAALATELDIPIGSESRFSTGSTRTFSPQGSGPVSRYLSAFDKAMRYALEVSDRLFSGGTESAVEASLQALGEKSNLSQNEIQALSTKTGERRTFKDDRMLTQVAKGTKDALNKLHVGDTGAGDLVMTFAATGTNVAHTAIDYSSGGVNGLAGILKLMHDVKTGKFDSKTGIKEITFNGKKVGEVSLVEAQRQAVTNAGRGITGVGLIAAFAAFADAGVLKVHEDDDYDKNALENTQDTSGAQLNVSAALRGITGESTEWQDGDVCVGMDFLEPFNAQMYIGYELSKEENLSEMVKAYPRTAISDVWQSVLDMPMMQSLSDLTDMFGSEDIADAAGQFVGNMASGLIPATVRQTAQYIDPYYRDTSGNDVWEKSLNQVKSYVPGLSQTLPKKYSGLGEEQLRYEDGLTGFFSTFIEPGDTAQIDINETVSYLGALSERTGDTTMYPDRAAPKSFDYKDEKGNSHTVDLSGAEETEQYQRTYGTTVSELYGELITLEDFTSQSDEVQVEILNRAKSYAKQLAQAAVSDYHEVPAHITNRPKGMSIAEAIIRQEVVGTTKMYTDLPLKQAVYIKGVFDLLEKEKKSDGSSYASVRTVQKVEALAGSNLSEKQQKEVMDDILDDGAYEKYVKILAAGYDTDDYAAAYRLYQDTEKTKYTGKKEMTIRAFMEELDISRSAAKTLYEIYSGTDE